MNTEATRLIDGVDRSYSTVLGSFGRQKLKDIEGRKQCAKTLMVIIFIGLLLLIGVFSFGMDKVQNSFGINKEVHNNNNNNNKEMISSSPNIIFIVMDDMGYSDMSARGSEFHTPNLDELYENSIEIKNHYIGLVCSPSRSQMITGRYAFNMGVSEQSPFQTVQITSFPTAIPTIGDLLLRYTNYHTYWTGKWHLGTATNEHTPLWRGFEKFYGFLTSNINYNDKLIKAEYYDEDYIDWRAMEDVDYDTQYDFSTFVTGDYMIKIINSHINDYGKDIPFYLQVPFQAVHEHLENIDSENSKQCDYISDDDRQLICQNILAVDQVIGDMIKNLKYENKIWDNTLIVFTSDNGGAYWAGSCNQPLRGGKETYFEGGIKTLAFMTGGYIDSIKNNANDHSLTVRKELMHGADWVPTILNIAGADLSLIEKELQDYIYEPVARKVSLNIHGSDKYYQDYLMQDSFDGKDLSNWLLYGLENDNDRSTVPLSINNIEDDNNRQYDVSIVFESKYTGNIYKFIYLTSKLGCKKMNTEICTFGADDGIDDSSSITTEEFNKLLLHDNDFGISSQVIEDDSDDDDDDDDDDSETKVALSIDDTKAKLEENSNEVNEKRYKVYSYFKKTNKFLFDLSNEGNELSNLMELYLDNFTPINVLEDDSIEKLYKNTIVNNVNNYDEKLVSLIWNEGLTKIKDYVSNSVLANNYLDCTNADVIDHAGPDSFGNAYGPYYTWDKYVDKFDQLCVRDINPVLKELFETKLSDYFIDNQGNKPRVWNQ